VAGLARDLSLELVAEGVERAIDRDVLLEFGYRRFQGFLYAPPLDVQDLAAFASSFSAPSSLRSEPLT
jgi:EAL domain-containing protein (putative c-di-GMP-specific phosphodiesterase class I)